MKQDLEELLWEFLAEADRIVAHCLDDDMSDKMDECIGEYADKVREAVENG